MPESNQDASPSPSRRYFYTDPLAAAWMAKHFGMQIVGLEYQPPTAERAGSPWVRINDFYDDRPFYIHPDSLPLLEPRVGDILFSTTTQKPYKMAGEESLGDAYATKLTRKGFKARTQGIIQRNGLAFHWPESEAA